MAKQFFIFFLLSFLFTTFSSQNASAFTKYNYEWDDYGLCARYHPDTGSFHGYAHFYCNPTSLNPDVQGASMNRVFQLKGTKQKLCGEFTAGGFFVRETDEAWLNHIMKSIGDSIKKQYLDALKEPDLKSGLKAYVKADGTPSLIAFYCAKKEGIKGGRGKTKVVGTPQELRRPLVKKGRHKGKCGFWRHKQGVKEKLAGLFKKEKFKFIELDSSHCK